MREIRNMEAYRMLIENVKEKYLLKDSFLNEKRILK
jgi:hypothetical protein